MNSKADYVRSQRQDRKHDCHWTGCDRQVPAAMWGCGNHWKALLLLLQRRVWATYVPGQERTLTPSRDYVEVAGEIQRWIADNGLAVITLPPPPTLFDESV